MVFIIVGCPFVSFLEIFIDGCSGITTKLDCMLVSVSWTCATYRDIDVQFTHLLLENYFIISIGCCDIFLIFFEYLMIIRTFSSFLGRRPLLIVEDNNVTGVSKNETFFVYLVCGWALSLDYFKMMIILRMHLVDTSIGRRLKIVVSSFNNFVSITAQLWNQSKKSENVELNVFIVLKFIGRIVKKMLNSKCLEMQNFPQFC